MIPVKVVDASALAAVVFNEPSAQAITDRLQGVELAAPALLAFELASVCLKKIQWHPQLRSQLLTAHRLASSLTIRDIAVDHGEVVLLAEQHKLSAYDASYIWLAKELGVELVSLDKRLLRVAALL